MVKCQHKRSPVICDECGEIRRRETMDRSMHVRGSGGGGSLIHQRISREEANALLKIIGDASLSQDDASFVSSLEWQMKNQTYQPTTRQIFWLRDIKDRCL